MNIRLVAIALPLTLLVRQFGILRGYGWWAEVLVFVGFMCVGALLEEPPCLPMAADPVNAQTCAFVASCGEYDLLRSIHGRGCDWDARTVEEAVCAGHLDIVRFAVENGCPCSAKACKLAVVRGRADIAAYLYKATRDDSMFVGALACNDVEVVKHLAEAGCKVDESVLWQCVAAGAVDLTRYFCEQQAPWGDNDLYELATRMRDLPNFQCLFEHKCPHPGNRVCAIAKENDSADILEYALRRNFPARD